MIENDLGIKVVVAYDHKHFLEICVLLGIDPRSVKYVNSRSNLERALSGYYREAIYPDSYAELRPPKQTFRISKEDHDNL